MPEFSQPSSQGHNIKRCPFLCFTPPAEKLHFGVHDIQFHWHIAPSIDVWDDMNMTGHSNICIHSSSSIASTRSPSHFCFQEKPLSNFDTVWKQTWSLSDCLKIVSIFEASGLSSVFCTERIKCCICKSSHERRHRRVFPASLTQLRPLSSSDPAKMRHGKELPWCTFIHYIIHE